MSCPEPHSGDMAVRRAGAGGGADLSPRQLEPAPFFNGFFDELRRNAFVEGQNSDGAAAPGGEPAVNRPPWRQVARRQPPRAARPQFREGFRNRCGSTKRVASVALLTATGNPKFVLSVTSEVLIAA